ncbi:MAG: RidA family protein [Robiginitomaculum sp.]|nr:RidA family protein [Robiginitomaculum sp.]
MKSVIMTAMGLVFISACQGAQELDTPTGIEIVTIAEIPTLGPYSTAIKAGGILYMSGIIAFDPKTKAYAPANIEAQTKQVFANIEKVLLKVDCTLDDILKMTVFLKNPDDFAPMNKVYASYFPNYKPARTTVPGVDWGRDDILIEIDVIAKLP